MNKFRVDYKNNSNNKKYYTTINAKTIEEYTKECLEEYGQSLISVVIVDDNVGGPKNSWWKPIMNLRTWIINKFMEKKINEIIEKTTKISDFGFDSMTNMISTLKKMSNILYVDIIEHPEVYASILGKVDRSIRTIMSEGMIIAHEVKDTAMKHKQHFKNMEEKLITITKEHDQWQDEGTTKIKELIKEILYP